MQLVALTNGAVTGTGTLTMQNTGNAKDSGKIGGLMITTDNTNQGTVKIQRTDASGKAILDIDTVTSMWIAGPFSTEGAATVYYTVSGTGCEAVIYEWVD